VRDEAQPAFTVVKDRSEQVEVDALTPSETKILAIDDDPRILRLLSHHLRQAGYQVVTASNGEEGLRIVLEQSPHIVVTDWVMPELTGIDVCRALRKIDAGRKTYVLILTARDDEQQIVDAFAAGADDYVTKPFNARILLARVRAGQRMIDLQRQVEADKTMRMTQVAEMGLLTRKLRAAALTDVLTGPAQPPLRDHAPRAGVGRVRAHEPALVGGDDRHRPLQAHQRHARSRRRRRRLARDRGHPARSARGAVTSCAGSAARSSS
jgi:CheY-like chemotaxis protein